MSSALKGPAATRVASVLALVLFVLALLVRGAKPAPLLRPEDGPADAPRIAEPMQLVSRGAALRIQELDGWVGADRRAEFVAARTAVFALKGCPATMDWLDGAEGQRFERTLGALRAGTREDALAALALVLQLARASEWKPGLLGKAQHAERLGGLLEDWLRAWAERGAGDATLVEPTLAAALLYGRVMRSAWDAPVVGHHAAPSQRALALLRELAGEGAQRTAFGSALQARHARALAGLGAQGDALAGFEEECSALFPALVGDCKDGR